jgi:hypothetical protein
MNTLYIYNGFSYITISYLISILDVYFLICSKENETAIVSYRINRKTGDEGLGFSIKAYIVLVVLSDLLGSI